jgi:hypothetical protein
MVQQIGTAHIGNQRGRLTDMRKRKRWPFKGTRREGGNKTKSNLLSGKGTVQRGHFKSKGQPKQ